MHSCLRHAPADAVFNRACKSDCHLHHWRCLSQGRKITAVANDKNWNFSVRESIWQETTVKESSPCLSSLVRASQRKKCPHLSCTSRSFFQSGLSGIHKMFFFLPSFLSSLSSCNINALHSLLLWLCLTLLPQKEKLHLVLVALGSSIG